MRRAPLLMILASLLLTVMVAAVKVARAELSTFDVMLWRCATALPLAWLYTRHQGTGLAVGHRGWMAARVLLGFGAMTCFFTSTFGLALADISILFKLQPIFVVALAPLVLGRAERSGPVILVVIALGLLGCGLIIGPGLAVGNVYGLWAVGAAILAAAAHVALRKLGQSDPPAVIVFWYQAVCMVLAAVGTVVLTGQLPQVPPAHLWPWLALTGVTATAGQLVMTEAYRLEKASIVAAASYVGPLWAMLGDLLVFGALPTAWALAGGVLVIAAGLLLVLRPSSPAPAT